MATSRRIEVARHLSEDQLDGAINSLSDTPAVTDSGAYLDTRSEKGQIATLRVFIRWCESIDAVPIDLSIKVVSPTLSDDEKSRDEMLDA